MARALKILLPAMLIVGTTILLVLVLGEPLISYLVPQAGETQRQEALEDGE